MEIIWWVGSQRRVRRDRQWRLGIGVHFRLVLPSHKRISEAAVSKIVGQEGWKICKPWI